MSTEYTSIRYLQLSSCFVANKGLKIPALVSCIPVSSKCSRRFFFNCLAWCPPLQAVGPTCSNWDDGINSVQQPYACSHTSDCHLPCLLVWLCSVPPTRAAIQFNWSMDPARRSARVEFYPINGEGPAWWYEVPYSRCPWRRGVFFYYISNSVKNC